MKNITKDNRGITLIALVITIILMLILASVTTYTGFKTYRNSKVNKFVAQMQLIQTKVDDIVSTSTIEELNNMQLQSITTDEQTNAIVNAFKQEEISTADISKFKVFTKENIVELFDVEDIENDIMVNFETREVVSTVGVKYNETIYYTQYKLPNGQTIINKSAENSRDLNFNVNITLDGLNATITVNDIKIANGTLSYKEENNNYWQTVTNYTEPNKTYTISINKSGNYIFKLEDNTDTQNYIENTMEIKLTNKPKTENQIDQYNYALTSENWVYTIDSERNNYVWIPRFAYKTNTQTNITEIKFIKGNSNIATDNTYVGEDWIIHSRFTTNNEIQLTGVWVSVSASEVKKTGHNMITLLNDDTRTILLEI